MIDIPFDILLIIINYIDRKPSCNLLLINKNYYQIKDIIFKKVSSFKLYQKLNFISLGGNIDDLKEYMKDNTYFIKEMTEYILDEKYCNSIYYNHRRKIVIKKYIRSNLYNDDQIIYNNIIVDSTYKVPFALYMKFRKNLYLRALIY